MEDDSELSHRNLILSWLSKPFEKSTIWKDEFLSLIEENEIASYLYHPDMEIIRSALNDDTGKDYDGAISVLDLYSKIGISNDIVMVPAMEALNKERRDGWFKHHVTDADVTLREDGVTPLAVACYHGKSQTVHLLLHLLGHSPDVRSQDGTTPLMETVAGWCDDTENRVQCLRHLLEYGASADRKNKAGHTVLTLAACRADLPLLRHLGESWGQSLDWEHRTTHGHTPLMCAVYGQNTDALCYLVNDRRVDPLVRNKELFTALDIALLLNAPLMIGLLAAYISSEKLMHTYLEQQATIVQDIERTLTQGSEKSSQHELNFVCCLLSLAYLGCLSDFQDALLENNMVDSLDQCCVWDHVSLQLKREFWLILVAHIFCEGDAEAMERLLDTNWAVLQFHHESMESIQCKAHSLDRFMALLMFFLFAENGPKWVRFHFKTYPDLALKVSDYKHVDESFAKGFYREILRLLNGFSITEGLQMYKKESIVESKNKEKSLRRRISTILPKVNNLIDYTKRIQPQLQKKLQVLNKSERIAKSKWLMKSFNRSVTTGANDDCPTIDDVDDAKVTKQEVRRLKKAKNRKVLAELKSKKVLECNVPDNEENCRVAETESGVLEISCANKKTDEDENSHKDKEVKTMVTCAEDCPAPDCSEVMKKDHSEVAKKDYSEVVKKDSEVVKKDYSEVVKKDYSEVVKKDYSEVVKKDYSEVVKKDYSEAVQKENARQHKTEATQTKSTNKENNNTVQNTDRQPQKKTGYVRPELPPRFKKQLERPKTVTPLMDIKDPMRGYHKKHLNVSNHNSKIVEDPERFLNTADARSKVLMNNSNTTTCQTKRDTPDASNQPHKNKAKVQNACPKPVEIPLEITCKSIWDIVDETVSEVNQNKKKYSTTSSEVHCLAAKVYASHTNVNSIAQQDVSLIETAETGQEDTNSETSSTHPSNDSHECSDHKTDFNNNTDAGIYEPEKHHDFSIKTLKPEAEMSDVVEFLKTLNKGEAATQPNLSKVENKVPCELETPKPEAEMTCDVKFQKEVKNCEKVTEPTLQKVENKVPCEVDCALPNINREMETKPNQINTTNQAIDLAKLIKADLGIASIEPNLPLNEVSVQHYFDDPAIISMAKPVHQEQQVIKPMEANSNNFEIDLPIQTKGNSFEVNLPIETKGNSFEVDNHQTKDNSFEVDHAMETKDSFENNGLPSVFPSAPHDMLDDLLVGYFPDYMMAPKKPPQPIERPKGPQTCLSGSSESGYISPSGDGHHQDEAKKKVVVPQQPAFLQHWQKRSQRWRSLLTQLQLRPQSVHRVGTINILLAEGLYIARNICGTVVRAGIRDDGLEVAVKCLARQQMVQNELKVLREVQQHPNIVQYKDYIEESTWPYSGMCYIALELCEYTLEEYVKELVKSKVLHLHCRRLCRELMTGLKALHDANIIHTDLKPTNILIDTAGGVKLADFGLSQKLTGDNTGFHHRGEYGTRCWRSPETVAASQGSQGSFKKSTDVFVAGMLLYYIQTGGCHPYHARGCHNPHACEQRVLQGHKPNFKVLPNDGVFSQLLYKMLTHDMAQRISTDKALSHPYFWTDQRRLEFLVTMGQDHKLLQAMCLRISPEKEEFFRRRVYMNSRLREFMGWTGADFQSVQSLLSRVICDVETKYDDIPDDIRLSIGEPCTFILACFPHLLMGVYNTLSQLHWTNRRGLKKFFHTDNRQ